MTRRNIWLAFFLLLLGCCSLSGYEWQLWLARTSQGGGTAAKCAVLFIKLAAITALNAEIGF